MSEKVKLARYRNTSYFVGSIDGSNVQYTWNGSRNGKAEIKEVPRDVVNWLTMNSICFDKGELVILEDDKQAVEEIKDSIVEREAYDNNTHTQEEIKKLLEGNINKMKAELKKITVDSEKQFVIEVANELKDELTKGKLDFLAGFMGVDSSILFD
jgi:hypothetical protein